MLKYRDYWRVIAGDRKAGDIVAEAVELDVPLDDWMSEALEDALAACQSDEGRDDLEEAAERFESRMRSELYAWAAEFDSDIADDGDE